MTSSLVGSEMCIRDRALAVAYVAEDVNFEALDQAVIYEVPRLGEVLLACLLYTSDAADDM
eukprot:7880272-Prorocentrum_lima.AAC.1